MHQAFMDLPSHQQPYRPKKEDLKENTLTGKVIRLFCSYADFCAGRFETDEGKVIAFRAKASMQEGDRLTMVGSWVNDPKFGLQFNVESTRLDIPMETTGILNLLARDKRFSGIGRARAQAIVDYCRTGSEFNRIVTEAPELLCNVQGITPEIAKTLHEGWVARKSFNDAIVALSAWGLTPHQVETLIDRFGNSAVAVLKQNPYVMIDLIDGFGFKRVDDIALKAGIDKNSTDRINAGIMYVVENEASDGHTWVPYDEAFRATNDLLYLDCLNAKDRIQAELNKLLKSKKLVLVENRLALASLYEMETYIGERFAKARDFFGNPPTAEELEKVKVEFGNDYELKQGQIEAIWRGINCRHSLITGPGGTGKTFIIARLVEHFIKAGKVVALAAPTGKAARRMTQMVDSKIEALTIHRLLGYKPPGTWEFDEGNKLSVDVLIIDEFSMVDVPLCWRLLKALPSETRLILVGDHNQLPSVGPGHLLRDILQQRRLPATVLTEVVRQAGALKVNSLAVLEGRVVGLSPADKSTDDWIVLWQNNDAITALHTIKHLYENILHERCGYDLIKDVQLLTPQHKGDIGVKNLNYHLQQIIQRKVYGFDMPDNPKQTLRLYPGDKVIQTKNNYEIDVMNGTLGVVVSIDPKELIVNFEDIGEVEIPKDKRNEVVLAYALTVHKAQGSEFPCVISIVHQSHRFMQHRNLFYTSVTRASKQSIIIGNRNGMQYAAKEISPSRRRTFLSLAV